MKSLTPEMEAHLAGLVTTLATIWRITRRDGVTLYSTDHDAPIEHNGATYLPTLGHARRSVETNSTVSVNNLEIQGLLDIDDPTEEDVRAGLYNMAEVEMAMINWQDTDMGEIPLLWGYLGEIQILSEHEYEAEILGPIALLQQNLLEISQSDCRADLGDDQCKIPILANILERGQAVALGEIYRVPTLTQGAHWENLITNASFEVEGAKTLTTSITGWTVSSGTWDIPTAAPQLGQFYLRAGNTATGEVQQTVDLVAQGANATNIDAGMVDVVFNAYRSNDVGSLDQGQLILEALNAGSGVISTLYDSTAEALTPGFWVARGIPRTAIPTLTRFLRVRFIQTRISGPSSEAALDNVTLELFDNQASLILSKYWPNIANNSSFEADPIGSNYTTITGWEVVSGFWDIADVTDLALTPHLGTKYLEGGSALNSEIRQTISLAQLKITDEAIDAGNIAFTFSAWRANSAASDTGRLILQGLANDGTILTTYLDTGLQAISPLLTWSQRTAGAVVAPNIRYFRIIYIARRVSGVQANSSLDDIVLALQDTSQIRDDYGIYQDKYYIVTQAGTTDTRTVPYNATPGVSTNDGTAILQCQEAFTRAAYIVDIHNPTKMTIVVDEPRAVDDWFNYGGMVFETGRNAGVAVEVQDWEQATGFVQLFLPPSYAPRSGDRVQIYAGCDKRLDTCNDKFNNILNYRGEPFDPGSDFFTSYPT